MPSDTPAILGHVAVLESLQRDMETDNVAHAYVFDGPKHVGKFTVARGFAFELLTFGQTPEGRQLMQEQLQRLLHPDVLVIDQLWIEDVREDLEEIGRTSNVQQEHRRKAGAKTDTISIDDIRAVQERLHEVPVNTYRCCLIRSAERMQDEAVNALLKILEEPPEGLVFILTTESMSSLLPTLISRSRVLRFSRLRDDELLPLLVGVPDDDRDFLLRIAQGAPGVVKRLIDHPEELRAERALYSNASSFWHSGSLQERLSHLSPLLEKGASADRFLLHLSLALREEILSRPQASAALQRLVRGMETNVHRQLLVQQFAMALAG